MAKGICATLHNPFKASLGGEEVILGFWSSSTSPMLAEMVAENGRFQWVLFDSEHAPNDVSTLMAQLQAIRFSNVPAVARPVLNHPVEIKRLLDIGFRSLLVPCIESADEARAAVRATRYPPQGVRGVSGYHRNNRFGADADYFDYIDEAIAVIAQIESGEAMPHLEEIGSVEGIDALFVGPGDLAASLGYLGKVKADPVQDAIRDLGIRARDQGVRIGIAAGTMEDVARYHAWGYSLFTVGSDVQLFRQAVEKLSESMCAFTPTLRGEGKG